MIRAVPAAPAAQACKRWLWAPPQPKNADLVVIKGDPATHIADIENVEIVFKDGVGYDSQRLLESANGHYGEF
jgi:hypothetical protein